MRSGTTSSLNPLGGQSDTRTWTRPATATARSIDANGNPQFNEIGATTQQQLRPAGRLAADRSGPDARQQLGRDHLGPARAVPEHLGDRRLLSAAVLQHRRGADNLAVDPDLDYTPFTIVGPTHPEPAGRRRRDHHAVQPEREQARRGEQRPDAYSTRRLARLQRLRGQRQRAAPGAASPSAASPPSGRRPTTAPDLTNSNPNNRRFCEQRAAVPDALQGVGRLPAAVRHPARRLVPGAARHPDRRRLHRRQRDARSRGGVPLTGGVSSITVNLVDPTTLFYDYVYTNDMTASRASSASEPSAHSGVRGDVQPAEPVDDLHAERDLRRRSGTTRSTWSSRGGSSSARRSTGKSRGP